MVTAQVEALLAPATPETDALLVGGGGLLMFTNFMLLSPAALRRLATPEKLDACREKLVACDPEERGAGCRFKRHSAPGEASIGRADGFSDESRRRRGRDVDIPWRRRRRGRDADLSEETSRGDAAAATWIFRRRRRRPK